MTRPDVERHLERSDEFFDTQPFDVAALCRYILALEAARDAVLPATDTGECDQHDTICMHCLHQDFDAAVARYVP